MLDAMLNSLSTTGTVMSFKKRMNTKLLSDFNPTRLEVIDESHLHAGHGPGFDGESETHFRIRIISNVFEGMGRLQRHRAINESLSQEFADGVHAVAIEAAAAGENVRW